MENPGADRPAAERREALRLILQFAGATDVVFGAGFALLGPGFLGGDPAVDRVIALCGGGLALAGVAMIAFARWRFAAGLDDDRTESVFEAGG